MDSDLDDINKIQSALNGKSRSDDFTISEASNQSDSGDGFSMANSYQCDSTPLPDGSFSIFEEFTSDSRDDEDQLIIDELEPSLENALTLNKAYQAVLTELLEKLEVLKVVNQTRQRTITAEIKELETLVQQSKKSNQEKKKRIPFTLFGIPYFKDQSYNTAPRNDDALLAEQIGFRLIVAPVQSKLLSKYETRRLKIGLKEQALTIQATRLMKKRAELQNQLKQGGSTTLSETERSEVAKNLKLIQREIFDVSEWPDEKLLDIDAALIDWQKISIVNFERSRPPDQIRLFFVHYVHPKVNTRPWTIDENRQLKALVKQYEDGIDWDELAKALNTNRTTYECFRRYQERYNPQHRKFGWDLNDNKKLISLISSQYGNRTSNEIEWDEVRVHFPGRSRSQLYAYYTQGCGSSFTAAEDTLILEGVKMGYGVGAISLLLGKRTPMQVRLRHKALKSKHLPSAKRWTEKEDEALLNLRDVTSLSKRVIKEKFPGRVFLQLFSRMHFLRMKKTTPEQYVKELKAKALERRNRPGCKRYFLQMRGRIMRSVARASPGYCESAPLKRSILPRLKTQLMYPIIRAKLDRELLPGRVYRHNNLSQQKVIAKKLKELKEIIRPYMALYTKRGRTITYVGDGRECGIILACYYRILRGNFSLAPKEELTVEQMEELGVEDHNFPGYESFISLIKDMEAPTSLAAPENIICLPPSLSTLVGFRGLLLHRKYLITSAKQEYALPQPNQTRIVELDDSEARPGSSSQRDDTISPMETTSPMEMGDHSAKSTNGDSLEIEPSESPVPTLEPSSLGIDRPTTSNQDISVTAVDEELEQRHLNSIANHEKPENMAEIMPESTHQSEYLLEPDESMFDEAQNFFDGQSQISVEESGPEEELEDVELQFGNKEADALLLSRLLSLFYWPGIMSTVNITEDMRRAAEQTTPDPEPEPVVFANEKLRKLEMKRKRREHIIAVVRRRFGKPEPPSPNQEPEPSSSQAEVPLEQEPPKKKKRERKTTVPPPPPPTTGRVTRSRSKSAANS